MITVYDDALPSDEKVISMILAVHPVVKAVFVSFLTTFFVSKSKITTEKSSRPTARRELMGKRVTTVKRQQDIHIENIQVLALKEGRLGRPWTPLVSDCK